MLIGYARVSTTDQDLSLQLDALAKAGCERLFTDKASGAKVDRPGLAEALHFARAGDALVIWKLDRLGRSIRGLIELAAGLSSRNVDFRSLTDGFDTATPSGRLLFHILASVAEMERELVRERTIAGLAAARAKGGTGGGRKGSDDARQDRHCAQAPRSRGQACQNSEAAPSRPIHLLPPLPGQRRPSRLRMVNREGPATLKTH